MDTVKITNYGKNSAFLSQRADEILKAIQSGKSQREILSELNAQAASPVTADQLRYWCRQQGLSPRQVKAANPERKAEFQPGKYYGGFNDISRRFIVGRCISVDENSRMAVFEFSDGSRVKMRLSRSLDDQDMHAYTPHHQLMVYAWQEVPEHQLPKSRWSDPAPTNTAYITFADGMRCPALAVFRAGSMISSAWSDIVCEVHVTGDTTAVKIYNSALDKAVEIEPVIDATSLGDIPTQAASIDGNDLADLRSELYPQLPEQVIALRIFAVRQDEKQPWAERDDEE